MRLERWCMNEFGQICCQEVEGAPEDDNPISTYFLLEQYGPHRARCRKAFTWQDLDYATYWERHSVPNYMHIAPAAAQN